MKTVSSIVENYIKTKPFLLNALSLGIINLTSLSRNIMSELESEFGKEVKQGAIVMSLKRLTEELDFRLNHKINKVIKNIGEITVRSALTDYTFSVSETVLNKQAELISDINALPDVFYTSSRGVNEINLVVSNSVNHLVDKHFVSEKLIQKLDNLASITVKLPKENTLAVVEVKTRSSLEFGLPQDFVKPKKIQLLLKAVNAYVNEKELDAEVRFDIIAIHKEGKKFVIEHLIDAFYHF